MIQPRKIHLKARARLQASVFVDGVDPGVITPVTGTIEVECSTAQEFAEVLKALVHIDEAIVAVQIAISALQMGKGPAERLPDLRKLQDIHFRLTGWHFGSTDKPGTLDNSSEEAIIPAKENPTL